MYNGMTMVCGTWNLSYSNPKTMSITSFTKQFCQLNTEFLVVQDNSLAQANQIHTDVLKSRQTECDHLRTGQLP